MNKIIEEKLYYKLLKIIGEIKNCEWDLKYNFKNNSAILNKLENLKKRKEVLEKSENGN